MFRLYKFVLLIILLSGFHLFTLAQKQSSEIKKLAIKADIIVLGKVTKKHSTWNEKKTRIYTSANLQVEQYIKGKGQAKLIEIVYPGGEVDDVGELYTHMPTFENNEEVLVFLKRNHKQNSFKIVNGEKGKITVIKHSKTKEKTTRSKIPVDDIIKQIKSIISE